MLQARMANAERNPPEKAAGGNATGDPGSEHV